jgi:hypothetical protein
MDIYVGMDYDDPNYFKVDKNGLLTLNVRSQTWITFWKCMHEFGEGIKG